jgi:hypothetical protein
VAKGDRLLGMPSLDGVHKGLFRANISQMMAGGQAGISVPVRLR